MSETDKINVDSIIARLLEVRGSRPGKAVQLTEAEIRGLCLKVCISPKLDRFLTQDVQRNYRANSKLQIEYNYLKINHVYQQELRSLCFRVELVTCWPLLEILVITTAGSIKR